MRFHHFAIEVKDLETSLSFYQYYIGLHEECRFDFKEEKIVFLGTEDFRLELISGGKYENQSTMHICFEVENIDEVINCFNENGIQSLEGPYKLQNGWQTVYYEGPDEEVIEFLQV